MVGFEMISMEVVDYLLALAVVSLIGAGCATAPSPPWTDESCLPYRPEPTNYVLTAVEPITIEQILSGRSQIIEAFLHSQKLNRDWFSFEASSMICDSPSLPPTGKVFIRDVYLYRFNNISHPHGPPDQRIIIWHNCGDDAERTNVYKVFTEKQIWYL